MLRQGNQSSNPAIAIRWTDASKPLYGERMILIGVADSGLFRLNGIPGEWRSELLLAKRSVQCFALDPTDKSIIYTGFRGNGVWKSDDGGKSWIDLHLPQKDVFSLAVSPADRGVYAGTEPSMLFKSADGGDSWNELDSLRQIPSAASWSYPPRPWTSHVSSIAPHPQNPRLLLAGIELGGVMRSEDGGASWADHAPGAQKDVHALAWHPDFPERAYEAGGGGAAWSRDGGRSWEGLDRGRDRHYTWALAVDPHNPDLWYISASPSARFAHSGGNSQAHLYRWLGDGPWRQMTGNLPETLNFMPYVLTIAGGWLFAGLANGEIYATQDQGGSWTPQRVDGQPLHGLRSLSGPLQT